ncbi:uncharacterized protein [Delphinus delphis]|uniref:uncharacterized protein n=1 Tax=Delphinus delphis TaxID=9728 RepID=UPI0028C47742|nr:splicing factor, arginine/serine-rich 19-like [Delphinus delphis]
MRGGRPAAAQRQPGPAPAPGTPAQPPVPSPAPPLARPALAGPSLEPNSGTLAPRSHCPPSPTPNQGYQGVALELGQPPADQYVQAQQFSETVGTVWGPRGVSVLLKPPCLFPGDQSPESQVAGALGDTQTEPSLDQVLRERDEAIAKKRAVEAELDIFKAKLRAVEAQLLEVLEEKLRLKQEVEAWEDDMQWMVRQQVESQLQRESRGALGAPMDPGTARTPWVRFPLHWWGRWR